MTEEQVAELVENRGRVGGEVVVCPYLGYFYRPDKYGFMCIECIAPIGDSARVGLGSGDLSPTGWKNQDCCLSSKNCVYCSRHVMAVNTKAKEKKVRTYIYDDATITLSDRLPEEESETYYRRVAKSLFGAIYNCLPWSIADKVLDDWHKKRGTREEKDDKKDDKAVVYTCGDASIVVGRQRSGETVHEYWDRIAADLFSIMWMQIASGLMQGVYNRYEAEGFIKICGECEDQEKERVDEAIGILERYRNNL